MNRIVVTGASGFLGRHVMPILEQRYGREQVIGVCARDYDLLQRSEADRMMRELRPTSLVHLAAYSGGIGANRAFPADFYYQNTLLVAQTFQAAAEFGVRKLLYTMGGCSYPASASSPIDESQMWLGYPQPESAGYSSAKKMGIVAGDAYRQQYGLESVVLVPGNMYGPFDNFREQESHVIPGLIRRFIAARDQDLPTVTMWGTGTPLRDFVYAGDVAATLPYFLDDHADGAPVNISSGRATSIAELAELLRELTGYRGRIDWDATKPDGQKVKIFSVERLHTLGLDCPTPLDAGLRRTIAWYLQHYQNGGDGIRL